MPAPFKGAGIVVFAQQLMPETVGEKAAKKVQQNFLCQFFWHKIAKLIGLKIYNYG
jgi:hypothetical protein